MINQRGGGGVKRANLQKGRSYGTAEAVRFQSQLRSFNKHAIAVREKPILLFDRMLIRLQGALSTSKRRHQHEQRGFRQMKICKQRAYYAKLKAGVDEDIRFLGSCWNAALPQKTRKSQAASGRAT